jgi:hypothetical protein
VLRRPVESAAHSGLSPRRDEPSAMENRQASIKQPFANQLQPAREGYDNQLHEIDYLGNMNWSWKRMDHLGPRSSGFSML